MTMPAIYLKISHYLMNLETIEIHQPNKINGVCESAMLEFSYRLQLELKIGLKILKIVNLELGRRRLSCWVGRGGEIRSDPAAFQHENNVGHGGPILRVRCCAKQPDFHSKQELFPLG